MKEVMSRIQLALVFMSGWLRYSLAEIVKVAQVFASKSGSNIDEQVAQIFIDIHTSSFVAVFDVDGLPARCERDAGR